MESSLPNSRSGPLGAGTTQHGSGGPASGLRFEVREESSVFSQILLVGNPTVYIQLQIAKKLVQVVEMH